VDGRLAQGVDRGNKRVLRGREVIVELHVADAPRRRDDRLQVLYGERSHALRLHRDRAGDRRQRIADRERVRLAGLVRIETRNERVDLGFRVGVYDVDTVHRLDDVAALQVGRQGRIGFD